MEGILCRKWLVTAIIILFIGTSIIPSICGDIVKVNSVTSFKEIWKEGCRINDDENDAELPTWKVGDNWNYKVEIEGGQGSNIDFDISIENLRLEVLEAQSDDIYKLDFQLSLQ